MLGAVSISAADLRSFLVFFMAGLNDVLRLADTFRFKLESWEGALHYLMLIVVWFVCISPLQNQGNFGRPSLAFVAPLDSMPGSETTRANLMSDYHFQLLFGFDNVLVAWADM